MVKQITLILYHCYPDNVGEDNILYLVKLCSFFSLVSY